MNDLFDKPPQKKSKTNDFFSVSELNGFIRDVITAGFPQPVWVCGEIQGIDRQKGKTHVFFQLIEKDPTTKAVKSVVDLVIWATKKPAIQQILSKSEPAFELKDDIEVKFLCTVDFYPPHGRVRLAVESIDPFYTIGKLAQEKQKLIAELTKAGVLAKNKQVELPTVPLRIGLITSHDSAAYNDFISELKCSGFGFQVLLRNTLMQGKSTERDVCNAIIEMNRKELDVIVITRGGGSIADLSCFDSEKIARTIADSRLPVLSGIGHEIDLSVTDLAAHAYAKTPTAIAQFIIQRVADFNARLDDQTNHLLELVQDYFDTQEKRLRQVALVLQNGTIQLLKEHHERMIRYREVLKWKPETLMRSSIDDLKAKQETIIKLVKGRLVNHRQQLRGYQKMVDIAHPVNTMKRGFSITRGPDGKILRSINQVKPQIVIKTELADGHIESQVNRVEEE